ncbi:MAG: hypothetical protein JWQ38_2076 [Flavipsychrobacter sp.]|nr:hypothetical protein [Flavipsychrobacter sp.]
MLRQFGEAGAKVRQINEKNSKCNYTNANRPQLGAVITFI